MKYIGDEIRMREVNTLLPIFVNKKGLLLDVGAGIGQYKSICENHGYEYLGIDKNHESEKNMVFKKDAFGAIAFDSRFNCILLIDVLEHVKNDAELINILQGLLAPGGYLLIHTPNKDGTHILCSPEDNKDHIRVGYTMSELSKLLDDNNLKPVTHRSTFNFHDALTWDLFYCLDHDIEFDTQKIKTLCMNHKNFVPYGLLVLAEKK